MSPSGSISIFIAFPPSKLRPVFAGAHVRTKFPVIGRQRVAADDAGPRCPLHRIPAPAVVVAEALDVVSIRHTPRLRLPEVIAPPADPIRPHILRTQTNLAAVYIASASFYMPRLFSGEAIKIRKKVVAHPLPICVGDFASAARASAKHFSHSRYPSTGAALPQ